MERWVRVEDLLRDRVTIGREHEIGELAALLTDPNGPRLITLVGPAGVGKSHLAARVFHAMPSEQQPDRWFIELAHTTTDDELWSAVAQHVGASDLTQSAFEAVATHLEQRESLLVLDNVEQIPTIAPQLDKLLWSAPALRVIATSRVRLRIAPEHAYVLHPLAVGVSADGHEGEQPPAAQLFVDRARRVDPDFALTPFNREAIVGLCERLDGLPLAIELAAAQLAILDPTDIVDRLHRRFDLLTDRSTTGDARHRTLRRAVESSYALLDVEEQQVLDRLAVFVDGCSIAAAEVVCASESVSSLEVLDALHRLRDTSMLTIRSGPSGKRVVLMETVREYARERLVEADAWTELLERHATYFWQLTQQVDESAIRDARPSAVDGETANLRSSVLHFLDHGDRRRAAEMCGVLWRHWDNIGLPGEMLRILDRVIGPPSDQLDPAIAPEVFLGAGFLNARRATSVDEYAVARELLQHASDGARTNDDLSRLGYAHYLLAQCANFAGDRADMRRHIRALTGYAHRSGAIDLIPRALFMEAGADEADGNLVSAGRRYAEGIERARATGDTFIEHGCMTNFAQLCVGRGDAGAALELAQDAVAVAERHDLPMLAMTARRVSAVAQLAAGDYHAAAGALRQVFDAPQLVDNVHERSICLLVAAATIAVAGSDDEVAARILGCARAARTRAGLVDDVESDRRFLEDRVAYLADRLGERFPPIVASGEHLTLHDGVALALRSFERLPVQPERTNITLLFTDVVGSTELIRKIGDDRWLEILVRHDQIIGSAVGRHGGAIVKYLGDGFHAAFVTTSEAVRCATTIQRELDRERGRGTPELPPVRIGVHRCEVYRHGNDYAGEGVHLAARVSAAAAADEILASTATLDLPESAADALVDAKGFDDPIPVVRVQWSSTPDD